MTLLQYMLLDGDDVKTKIVLIVSRITLMKCQ